MRCTAVRDILSTRQTKASVRIFNRIGQCYSSVLEESFNTLGDMFLLSLHGFRDLIISVFNKNSKWLLARPMEDKPLLLRIDVQLALECGS